MMGTSVRAAMLAEWTKMRSLWSTFWALLAAFVVSVGLSVMFSATFRADLPHRSPERLADFDPLFAAFYSLTLGQLAMVVFGVLTMGGEYSSGTIRASLMAVPHRGLFYAGKLLAALLPVLVLSTAIVLISFFSAQALLSPYETSLDAPGTVPAMVGAVVYLSLITLLAMGMTAMLRSSTAAMVILLPLLFLGSQGLSGVPGVREVAQYLPDHAGLLIVHIFGNNPRFHHHYGPWTGVGILALWTVAALAGGYFVLRRRDA